METCVQREKEGGNLKKEKKLRLEYIERDSENLKKKKKSFI